MFIFQQQAHKVADPVGERIQIGNLEAMFEKRLGVLPSSCSNIRVEVTVLDSIKKIKVMMDTTENDMDKLANKVRKNVVGKDYKIIKEGNYTLYKTGSANEDFSVPVTIEFSVQSSKKAMKGKPKASGESGKTEFF